MSQPSRAVNQHSNKSSQTLASIAIAMAPFIQQSDEDNTAFAADSTHDARQSRADAAACSTTPANSIARSMSRYRKRANSTAASAAAQEVAAAARPGAGEAVLPSMHATPPMPPVPTIPLQHMPAQAGASATRSRHIAPSGTSDDAAPSASLPAAVASYNRPPPPRLHERQPLGTSTPSAASSRQASAERESISVNKTGDAPIRRQRTNSDEDKARLPHHEQAIRVLEPMTRMEPLPERMATKPKKDVAPLQLQMQPNQAPAPPMQKSQRSPVIEKFASLTKLRKANPVPEAAPRSAREDKLQENQVNQSVGIVSGGKGIVPQTDAPTSAINTADQIVTVRCRGNRFLLDVDADTTAIEIITKCGRLVNDTEINPSNCIVLESFDSLGLERRVRRYEAIRDIVNSWDLDSTNCLVVRIREAGDSMTDLDAANISKSTDPPKGCQIYMYHSNKPGKWNKRYITLLDNGQIILSKKPDAYAGEKDSTNLCRLSDYDIYQPSESMMRRHLKPPKRHCFAIRSQQKTTVFLNTDNYVQYFSMEDPKQAALFQDKVQVWRSWYLLDRRPEPRKQSMTSPPRPTTSKKEESKSSPSAVTRHGQRRSVNLSHAHRAQVSVDESPYTIGEFKPLLDLSRFDKRISLFGNEAPPPIPTDSPRTSRDLSRPNRNSLIGKGLIDSIKTDDGFTGNGLLANGYEERRDAIGGAVIKASQADPDGFADGPTLLNKQNLTERTSPNNDQGNSSSWFPSALEHTAKQTAVRPVNSTGPSTMRRQQPMHTSAVPPLPSNQSSGRHQHAGMSSNHGVVQRSRESHQPPQRSHESRGGVAQSSRREQPKPLLDIGSTEFNKPPQWKRKGHGVKAPGDIEHLVDYISPTDPFSPDARRGTGMLDAPARNSTRRPSPNPPSGSTAYPPPISVPAGRARSQSFSNTSGNGRAMMAAIAMAGSNKAPPMPTLPGLARRGAEEPVQPSSRQREGLTPREKEQRERERLRRKEQERAYKERQAAFNAVPGRKGTLKVV
ncbi:uncharacterized protein B0I36DRAFT_321376 [Microdochium trichocladiopsis]|uniref:PH domain-containing protein n=1 Tax=Microdochium trichocladiopsis TaxID=1682393 RepID=A0A9P8YC70_9PEZI|nr:uncharacterized protein B0I36DRAFT_321376 [Microdochium trichocladiopsis]KAH7033413.1 hypothetical protein B0I36DRAFT_321376 [Microdochium trichocladiopsis]